MTIPGLAIRRIFLCIPLVGNSECTSSSNWFMNNRGGRGSGHCHMAQTAYGTSHYLSSGEGGSEDFALKTLRYGWFPLNVILLTWPLLITLDNFRDSPLHKVFAPMFTFRRVYFPSLAPKNHHQREEERRKTRRRSQKQCRDWSDSRHVSS